MKGRRMMSPEGRLFRGRRVGQCPESESSRRCRAASTFFEIAEPCGGGIIEIAGQANYHATIH